MRNNIFYTYQLINSLDNTVIYVGKGCKNRMFVHEKIASNTKSDTHLSRKIRKIILNGGTIIAEKIRENLTENDAWDLEIKTIAELGLDNLCNVSLGGNGGDLITMHPNYEDICKKGGNSRRGKKRDPKIIQQIINTKKEGWFTTQDYKDYLRRRSIAMTENNPGAKFVKNETLEERKKRMTNLLNKPRWNIGKNKNNDESMRLISEKLKGREVHNANPIKVKNVITGIIYEFKSKAAFSKHIFVEYNSTNSKYITMLQRGEIKQYKDYILEK